MSNTPQWALDKIREAREQQLTRLNLNGHRKLQLNDIPSEVFDLTNLQMLDLGSNQLSKLPKAITRLPNLYWLDLSHNQLGDLPQAITRMSNLQGLNLSFTQLTDLPKSFSRLTNLKTLDLDGNRLSDLPQVITRMSNLQGLNLNFTQLTDLPKSFSRLTNLKSLNLSNNQLSELPEVITHLPNLESLSLVGNHLNELPEPVTRLTNLKTLDLNGNRLSELSDAIAHLSNLERLDLSRNQLSELPEAITHLSNLKLLHLSHNQLSELPQAITRLPNLDWLDLSHNQLSELPQAITHLSNLHWLDLCGNQLNKLPEVITHLTDLEKLDLRDNQLSELPETITRLSKLESLYLSGNLIEVPPPEILDLQGSLGAANLDKIRNYFEQLATAEAVDHLYEAKLLIVGEGEAGKTTLANKIIDPAYQLRLDEDTTRGIDVFTWAFLMDDGRPFDVNIWDFGGQAIYHTTHQFFLTKRSLYVLVADTRKDDTDFDYWLNVVDLLSDSSPLLIVKNEKGDRHREINIRHLKGRFEGIKDVLATNLKDNRGLDELTRHLKTHLLDLPIVGVPLPKTWVDVRKALETDPRNYIDCEEFRQICRKCGFEKEEDIQTLSGYLHDLGVCLHFRDDDVLREVVILKPEWGTDAVYRVLDNHDVLHNEGRFTWGDLVTIWHEPEYEDMRFELLSLMLKFGLCYRLPSTEHTYIAPQLLTENQPEFDWDTTDNLQLRFTYDFMPKGIITRFIVAMHQDIALDPNNAERQLVWKSGVILHRTDPDLDIDAFALIIEDYARRTLSVRIAGRKQRLLMASVVQQLNRIHDTFHNLAYNVLIPCNCSRCIADKEPHFFKLEMLERAVAAGVEAVLCEKSFQQVDPRTLIHDMLIYRRQPNVESDDDLADINTHIEGDIHGDVYLAGRNITRRKRGDDKS